MLEGGKTILRMGQFELRMRHLLVIGVLAIAFTTAFIIRSYPSKYGFYLNEFDPYFDYRATKYIVDHGLNAYFNWHDTMSWYPEGRNVPATSQSGLHIVAAFLYKIFGAGTSLLDFTILLPVVLGSLTTIVVFALVRTLGGTTAGMFSALLFAFSPAIIQRGNLGWFKSEPLGLFFGLLGVCIVGRGPVFQHSYFNILYCSAVLQKRYHYPGLYCHSIYCGNALDCRRVPTTRNFVCIWLSRSRINGRYNISNYSSLCQKIERA